MANNTDDVITTTGVAKLFGISVNSLRACIDSVKGFPEAVIRGHTRTYSSQAVQTWKDEIQATGADPAEIIREAYRQHQAAHRHGDNPQNTFVNQLFKDFSAGRFLPADQKMAMAARRQSDEPKQKRERIIQRIRPDWF